MTRSSRKHAFKFTLLAILTGCSDRDPVIPTTSSASPSPRSLPIAWTLDEAFAAVADLVPGFAGMYFDSLGGLVVPSVEPLTPQTVAAALDAAAPELMTARIVEAFTTQRFQVIAARYDFRQLLNWKREIYQGVVFDGVVFVDIDEVRNELHIGTTTDQHATALLSKISDLGIPLDGVRVTAGHVAKRNQTLADRFRPVPGGVRVEATLQCTITANLRIDDNDYFMTSSHCSYRFGDGGDGTAAYQNNARNQSDLIGYEAYDPYLSEPGLGYCPAFFVEDGDTTFVDGCRYSDAAIWAYSSYNLAQYGVIARTTGLGSTTISTSTPRFLITGESLQYPLVGTAVHMMGQISGWRAGTVTYGQEVWPGVDNTCVDAMFPGDPIVSLCQAIGNYYNTGGDSGAPIFTWDGQSSGVELIGINVGTLDEGSVFSPWLFVSLELTGDAGAWEIVY